MRNKERKQPTISKKQETSVYTPSIGSTLLGGIFQGFSFGTGSAMAHNLFRWTESNHSSKQSIDCEKKYQDYEKLCVTTTFESTDLFQQKKCKELFEDLKKICPP